MIDPHIPLHIRSVGCYMLGLLAEWAFDRLRCPVVVLGLLASHFTNL